MEDFYNNLFKKFLNDRRYLKGCMPKTIYTYSRARIAYTKHASEVNRKGLHDFVAGLRAGGMGPGGANVYIRSVHSFLSWD